MDTDWLKSLLPLKGAAFAALFLIVQTALAERLADFQIIPSADYTVADQSGQKYENSYRVSFTQRATGPTGGTCLVSFIRLPENAGLTKAELNAFQSTRQRGRQLQSSFKPMFEADAPELLTLQGYVGHGFKLKMVGSKTQAISNGYMVLVETALGRMIQSCFTQPDDYEAMLPRYKALTENIAMPE
ncbi:MAG: hypothetical protein AAFR13_03535 [Pseudomonadota bacterium]